MKFEPNLKLCEIEQKQLLSFWKKNQFMSKLMQTTERIICAPDSFNIYDNFGKVEYFKTLDANEKLKADITELLNEYFKEEKEVYLLFAGCSSQIDEFGLSDRSYPIFVIKYKNIKYWIDLAIDKTSHMLIISSLDFKTVVDISNLAEEDHSDTRTVYLKAPSFIYKGQKAVSRGNYN